MKNLKLRIFLYLIFYIANSNIFAMEQNKVKETEKTCCICFDDLTPKTTFYNICGHKNFHIKCIQEWIKNNKTCPICREIIYKEIKGTCSSCTSKSKTNIIEFSCGHSFCIKCIVNSYKSNSGFYIDRWTLSLCRVCFKNISSQNIDTIYSIIKKHQDDETAKTAELKKKEKTNASARSYAAQQQNYSSENQHGQRHTNAKSSKYNNDEEYYSRLRSRHQANNNNFIEALVGFGFGFFVDYLIKKDLLFSKSKEKNIKGITCAASGLVIANLLLNSSNPNRSPKKAFITQIPSCLLGMCLSHIINKKKTKK